MQAMTGTETAEAAAEVFHRLGVKHVIIKCGERGCYYSMVEESSDETADMAKARTETSVETVKKGWAEAIPVKTVDTTGAGDCMVAAFISRILHGDSLEEACRYACAAGSYKTLFSGASTAKLSDEIVREYLE